MALGSPHLPLRNPPGLSAISLLAESSHAAHAGRVKNAHLSASLLPLLAAAAVAVAGPAPVLDHQALLDAQSFWDNRDWDWYKANIPFLDTPDAGLNTTWYYRWELVTKHAVYGSPKSGYTFTEFIDRPFWSGKYGAISCPAGHQMYEIRWLHDATYARDYSSYWFRVEGAQPRRYGCWLLDGIHAASLVHPDRDFMVGLLPDFKKNYEGWEQRQFVPEQGMFWQNGHDDGMEFNINSRQTQDILRGANGFRPGFNAYMAADALAIAETATLAGDTATATAYREKAAALQKQINTRLWDPAREFYFPMSMKEEKDKEGNVVKPLTLTYQSGKYAGSNAGRELHGYLPWQFNLAAPGRESAWRFLKSPEYFEAAYGPYTVEKNDPMFLLQKGCCWWSGQSWPYATAQTLTALANVLNGPQQGVVTREDYWKLLCTFSKTHRKNNRPYLAEAAHPDTGSFEGHDAMGHSNHYFHSSFCDQVITGLAGLRPRADDTLEVNPLAPAAWDWFGLDHIPYRGHELAIIWDRDGSKYKRGAGLTLLADGEKIASSPALGRLTATLAAKPVPPAPRRVNYAVSNDGDFFPSLTASHEAKPAGLAQDGNYWYELAPPNHWSAEGSGNPSDWLALDFGIARKIDTVKVLLLNNSAKVTLEAATGDTWEPVATLDQPAGHRPAVFTFPPREVRKLRATITPLPGSWVGVTEIEAWGAVTGPIADPPPPPGHLGVKAKATASFTSQFDKVSEANDGKISLRVEPRNRWTCWSSPSPTDWLQLEWPEAVTIGRCDVHIFDDHGGVQAPDALTLDWWDGAAWQPAPGLAATPPKPKGGVKNTFTFTPVKTTKLRLTFTHHGQARSGVSEVEVWEK